MRQTACCRSRCIQAMSQHGTDAELQIAALEARPRKMFPATAGTENKSRLAACYEVQETCVEHRHRPSHGHADGQPFKELGRLKSLASYFLSLFVITNSFRCYRLAASAAIVVINRNRHPEFPTVAFPWRAGVCKALPGAVKSFRSL